MLGELLVAVGEDRVADVEAVLLQFGAVEVRVEPDEEIDVAVARDPRAPRRRPDLDRVGVDGEVDRSIRADSGLAPV